MVEVNLENLVKTFGPIVAVDNVSLQIKHGEFFTLLGPSGCGKTTTLRMIAGFYTPEKGSIKFNEKVMNVIPAEHRNTGMVFQNYAIWPHMTVAKNVAFGLEMRKIAPEEIAHRVKDALDLVELEGLEDRTPDQLSGGQQQRVALARALIIEPDVLLLDEPLSNLDAKLRVEMRKEIKNLQKLGPSAENLIKIKEMHRREHELNLKENSYWLNALYTRYWNNLDPVGILKAKEKIEKLTTNDIQDAAQMYLNLENYIHVVLLPEKVEGEN